MDHLPPVNDPFEPIQIPYLGGPEYDGLDFAGYPARRFGDGFQVSSLINGNLQGRTELEASQFLQTWLYFGMLCEAYRLGDDHRLNQGDFVRMDVETGKELITTTGLPGLFNIWHERFKAIPKESEAYSRYYGRFRACMLLACGVFRDLMERSYDKNANQILSHEILLSIQILGAAIDIGISEVCKRGDDYTWRIVPRSEWLMKRMVNQGWCPCIVEQLSRPCATFLYYSSLLGPPSNGYIHVECKSGGRACVAANVKDGVKYVSKHVVDGCDCNLVVVETGHGSKVASAISKQEIPVIQLSGEDEHVTTDVRSYSSENQIPFVAISHVWSDGLGDPIGNRLPQCQINRIFKLLRELPQSLGIPEPIDAGPAPADAEDITPKACYFWMDTLCIPKDATLRHHAITKMSEVYSSASKVLVITAEFIQHPSINRSYMEIFTRISRSTWLRRLWTLQEATLNRELLFQFSDQAVSVNDNSARARLQERENIEMPWDLVRWECNRYHFDNFFGRQQTSYTRQENQVWQGLQHRTTSRGGDEPLCIAILLGLNVEQLQEEPDAHSVKKFWRLHEKRGVPAQVLFIPGPKLDEDGLHWALSNLMDLRIVGGDITAHADVTPRGLCAKWPGILLEPLKQPANFVIPVEVEGQIFYVRQNLISSAPSWTGLHLHERKLAIILMIVRRIGSGAIDGLESGLGAMVQVLSEGEEHHVKYLRLVSLLRKDEFADRHPNTPWKSGEIKEKLGDPAHGIFLDSRQRWCVG